MPDEKFYSGMAIILSLMSLGFAYRGRLKESTATSIGSLVLALIGITK